MVGITSEVLPDELNTVPELFGESGYTTAGISRNGYLSSATGLNRGFEEFEWISSSTIHKVGIVPLIKYVLNLRKHSVGLSTETSKYSTPYLLNEVAKRWMGSLNEPFFMYLHYNEPHRPYYPPLPYIDKYTEDIEMSAKEAAEFSHEFHDDVNEVIAEGCNLTDDEWDALIAMYDAEIAYTDEMVGRLFDYVQKSEVNDAIFIITADHGELFGEHDLLSHMMVLDDAVINVPLVAHGVEGLSKSDPDGLVQHQDVMKVLLNIAGADTDSINGIDIREESREYAFSQRKPLDFEHLLRNNPDYDTSRFHSPLLTCVRTHDFKYQRSDEGSELFKLPDEDTDVSDEYPEKTGDLERELDRWLSEKARPVNSEGVGEEEFSEDVKNHLRNMGYLE